MTYTHPHMPPVRATTARWLCIAWSENRKREVRR